jgi:hypothetical protein
VAATNATRIKHVTNTHEVSRPTPEGRFAHSVPCPCRPHTVLLPCRAAKGLECVFPIWFTQCGRVWFTLAMPRSCHALTMPFFSRPLHSTAVERRPVGYLPAFGFFRLPRGVPWRLSSGDRTAYGIGRTLIKVKGHPRTGHEVPEGEYRFNPTRSLSSALGGGR